MEKQIVNIGPRLKQRRKENLRSVLDRFALMWHSIEREKARKVFLGDYFLSERGSHRLQASLSSDNF